MHRVNHPRPPDHPTIPPSDHPTIPPSGRPTVCCSAVCRLPPYADAIRSATGLPVLDSITLVDYFHAGISENPYFGIDWQKLAATPAFK